MTLCDNKLTCTQPVGRGATFQYVIDSQDACLIMTMTYSTQQKIIQYHLNEIESPPLSHSSDMAFLAWKRSCEKHQTDLKSLRHIFISIVTTPSTQNVVASILRNRGTRFTDRADLWTNQLPRWGQKLTFLHDSDEGKALHGTVQLKAITWMLVQHREHLGMKAVKSISLFRGVLPGSGAKPDILKGPTFYIELEDVQSGANVGRIRRSEPDSGIESEDESVGEESVDYHDYVDEGIEIARWLKSSDDEVTAALVSRGDLHQGDQLASRFADFQSFRDSGWNMRDQTPDLLNNFNTFAAFRTALKSLKISDKPRPQGKLEATIYEHTLQWMDGSESREVSLSPIACDYLTAY